MILTDLTPVTLKTLIEGAELKLISMGHDPDEICFMDIEPTGIIFGMSSGEFIEVNKPILLSDVKEKNI